MAQNTNIRGDWNINSIGPTDKINITSSAVTINGNLFVTGNSQTIVSTDSAITDHLIVLNNGLGTSPPNPLGANIIVDRGSSANVSLAWNETVRQWQITNDGSTYSNIATVAGSGSSLTAIVQDTNPTLGGNLNITGYTIYDTNYTITHYAGTPGGGKSGLYVDNTNGTRLELATKSASIAYSIIFG
jgi:hypothetical protein